jgi:hypothetical protein
MFQTSSPFFFLFFALLLFLSLTQRQEEVVFKEGLEAAECKNKKKIKIKILATALTIVTQQHSIAYHHNRATSLL